MFGIYVDNVIWLLCGMDFCVCSDLLVMLFFEEFGVYDGGELCVEDMYGVYCVKLLVGDFVLYLVLSLYYVMLVMCGECVVLFFWI